MPDIIWKQKKLVLRTYAHLNVCRLSIRYGVTIMHSITRVYMKFLHRVVHCAITDIAFRVRNKQAQVDNNRFYDLSVTCKDDTLSDDAITHTNARARARAHIYYKTFLYHYSRTFYLLRRAL